MNPQHELGLVAIHELLVSSEPAESVCFMQLCSVEKCAQQAVLVDAHRPSLEPLV